jgi:hypothetical protein
MRLYAGSATTVVGAHELRESTIGGEPGAAEDQDEACDRSRAGALAEDADAKGEGDEGVEVGDDESAAGPDLDDQGSVERECGGGAEQAQSEQCGERVRRGRLGRPIDGRLRD